MALSHVTKVFAIRQAKISKVLTDPTGGSATYGTSVTMTGAKSLKIAGTTKAVELRGDNTLLDGDVVLQTITAELAFAKFNFDAFAIALGATVADTGTTPNQVTTLTLTGGLAGPPALGFFKIEGQAVSADPTAGDVHFILPKCKITDFPDMGLNEEDYQTSTLKVNAYPRLADNQWLQAILNETAVAIA